MITVRRRLLFWLIRAYVKKWRKTIGIFFIFGLVIFFVLKQFSSFLAPSISIGKNENIGIVGVYTFDTLPASIFADVSDGLTKVENDYTIHPALASSWDILDDGKRYIFHLNPTAKFGDGTPVTSQYINYSFADVAIKKLNSRDIEFDLKDSYSPFLVTVSRPIFKKGNVGTKGFYVSKIKLNGNFIQSIVIRSEKSLSQKTYIFYSTQNALKMGYVLGEVSSGLGVIDTRFKQGDLSSFPNTKLKKSVDSRRLVTLFFNTKDATLSNEKVRSALVYGLPNQFSQGLRNNSSFPKTSWAYWDELSQRGQDIDHATILLKDASVTNLSITIKTLPRYKKTAEEIQKEWRKLGVSTKIETQDDIPSSFQAFIGDFILPRDPDQYTLWHNDQENNITKYSSLRIDKLLEDGRKTTDINKRKKIYDDFQKYLIADSPAAFLFLPFQYDITKK